MSNTQVVLLTCTHREQREASLNSLLCLSFSTFLINTVSKSRASFQPVNSSVISSVFSNYSLDCLEEGRLRRQSRGQSTTIIRDYHFATLLPLFTVIHHFPLNSYVHSRLKHTYYSQFISCFYHRPRREMNSAK